jgi:ABC-type antimicrobial peptide transport system permease subunit
VINEEMARKYFAGTDPIGKRIRLRYIDEKANEEPWLTIIGVVGNTRSLRYNRIRWDRYPAVYISLAQRTEEKVHNFAALTLYIYFRTPYSVSVSTIADVVHSLNPNLPVGNIRSTGDIVSSLRSQPRLRATLLAGFAALTLLLAAIGVYGVMMQMTEQRRRDIGVRIALGALASDIRAWILRRALALTVVGLLAGVVGAAIVTRLLRGFLYGISALDPTIFLGVVLLLCAVALLASYLPARRASKVDPMEMLRSE